MRSLSRETGCCVSKRDWFSRAGVDVMMGGTSLTHWKSEDLRCDKNEDPAGVRGDFRGCYPPSSNLERIRYCKPGI